MDKAEMIVDSINELRESIRGMREDKDAAKTDSGRDFIHACIVDAQGMVNELCKQAVAAGVHPDLWQEVHLDYTHQELHDAFGLLHLGVDWKAPVDALVPTQSADAVSAAIGYFCGGGAVVEAQRHNPDYVMITAPGYYALIGA